jgi:hypothetical protein
MSGKRARSLEVAADEAYRVAEMRRKAPAGRVNREARTNAKVIQKAVEGPRKKRAEGQG